MQSTTPAFGDSLSIGPVTQFALRRRGRPRKYFATEGRTAESARKAAYRARLREKLERGKKRARRCDISRLMKAQGILRLKFDKYGPKKVLEATPDELKLTNKILSAQGAGMTRGQFLSGAPTGCGELVSGGYNGEKVSFILGRRGRDAVELADGCIAPLQSGRRVVPKGWGSRRDEATGSIRSTFTKKQKESAGETDLTFIDRHCKDKSELTCYAEGCRRLVSGTRVAAGREKYHCDLHAPISEAA
jgi:hypothetical protein